MLYLNSIPVQIWQRTRGDWEGYFINAKIVQDVSGPGLKRTVSIQFDDEAARQGYIPALNDMLVPLADWNNIYPGAAFDGYLTRTNQPYYYATVNQVTDTKPGILFLTAYNDTTLQFSDFFALPEYGIINDNTASDTVYDVVCELALQVWNRLVSGHPFIETLLTRDNVYLGGFVDDGVVYEPGAYRLDEEAEKLASRQGYINAGGTSFRPDSTSSGLAGLSWNAAKMLPSPLAIDVRREDLLQIEVRSRDTADNPNVVGVFDNANGSVTYAHMGAPGVYEKGFPGYDSSNALRVKFVGTDKVDWSTIEPIAKTELTTTPTDRLSDTSFVLDLSNRYNTQYSQSFLDSWTLPAIGAQCYIYGYHSGAYTILPVRSYEFVSQKMLLSNTNDITFESGH